MPGLHRRGIGQQPLPQIVLKAELGCIQADRLDPDLLAGQQGRIEVDVQPQALGLPPVRQPTAASSAFSAKMSSIRQASRPVRPRLKACACGIALMATNARASASAKRFCWQVFSYPVLSGSARYSD